MEERMGWGGQQQIPNFLLKAAVKTWIIFGSSWIVLRSFREFRSVFENFGDFWRFLEIYRGVLNSFSEFWRVVETLGDFWIVFEEKKLRLEVSTLSLCSELWHLWLNSVFGVTLMGVIFMGSAVTFMGNCDIYGKRYDIYGELWYLWEVWYLWGVQMLQSTQRKSVIASEELLDSGLRCGVWKIDDDSGMLAMRVLVVTLGTVDAYFLEYDGRF